VYFAEYQSPVGKLLLTTDGTALTGLWLDRDVPETWIHTREHPVLTEALQWLEAYFSGTNPPLTVALAPQGTDFQQRVWKRLVTIPWGETCTYGDIAREMEAQTGKPMSAQAVGGAVGRNPISIMIPCHRVVGAGGKLTGYAWGLERKLWLLRHEGLERKEMK